ncbi:MAG: hypothetical protein J5958_07215 [Clostridia bacterium]|nr:hypothetical protein [Clostridia bacterium]
MKNREGRGFGAVLIAFFVGMLILAGIWIGVAVRFAYVRYTGNFGSGSLAGLSELSVPILVLILGAPVLGFLFASLVTFRAIRRAKKKEDEERENDPERADEDSDF